MVEADGYFQHTEVEVNETGVQRVSIELTSESGEGVRSLVVAEPTRSNSALIDCLIREVRLTRRVTPPEANHFIAHGITGVRQRSSGEPEPRCR